MGVVTSCAGQAAVFAVDDILVEPYAGRDLEGSYTRLSNTTVAAGVRGACFPVDYERERGGAADAEAGLASIVVIEPRTFLRECIRRGMQASLRARYKALTSVEELERDPHAASARIVILSCCASEEGKRNDDRENLRRLNALLPHVPVVVLASRPESELVRISFESGAKGYIPMSMGFDLAVEAVRFVLAGGTYIPAECLLNVPDAGEEPRREQRVAMTARENSVLRGIQQGKPNKTIAYELNMCESTVKVHVRHIMKKLGAKNRTAVAVKSNALLGA